MGKAARRGRGSAGVARRRSAYVRIWQETRIAAERSSAVGDYSTAAWYRTLTNTLSNARVVELERTQAEALSRTSADLAMDTVAPPFPVTLIDLNGFRLGDIEVVAMLVLKRREAPLFFYSFVIGASGRWNMAGTFYGREHGTHDDVVVNNPEWAARNPDIVEHAEREGAATENLLAGLLMILESANVDLVPGQPKSKSHRAHGVPHYEVVIRQTTRRTPPTGDSTPQDWSHRWEVRGHFKHFGEDTRLFALTEERQPGKIVERRDGSRCVRIWCPPFVKGPEDKPLIPKVRRVAAAYGGAVTDRPA